MRTKNIYFFLMLACILALSACSSFFDKDNTPAAAPLSPIQPTVKVKRLFTTNTGAGSGYDYLKMNFALGQSALYIASRDGRISAVDKKNGHILWNAHTGLNLLAGPGVGDGLVVVGSQHGTVLALRQSDGKQQWRINLSGEILANPVVADHHVIVKLSDGRLQALSTQEGKAQWLFQQVEPNLILRASSSPLIHNGYIIAGFANGNLVKLNLKNSELLWLQAIATAEGGFSVDRMIDIDANPILYQDHIYAATYQGKIAALSWESGNIKWSHNISSYAGMAADQQTIYISDAKSHLSALNAHNGTLTWSQTQLEARGISTPAVMGNYVVVGDKEGIVHWLTKSTGQFAAREKIGAPIYATPIMDEDILYVLTTKGSLFAYRLN